MASRIRQEPRGTVRPDSKRTQDSGLSGNHRRRDERQRSRIRLGPSMIDWIVRTRRGWDQLVAAAVAVAVAAAAVIVIVWVPQEGKGKAERWSHPPIHPSILMLFILSDEMSHGNTGVALTDPSGRESSAFSVPLQKRLHESMGHCAFKLDEGYY